MGCVMRTNSAIYRQNGGSRTSILLQQVTRKKDSCGIMLTCICTMEKPYASVRSKLCERLLCSFREDILAENAVSMAECRHTIEKILINEAVDCRKDMSKYSYSGMLCIDSEVLLFAAGDQRIYLINSAFMRPHISLVLGEGDYYTPQIEQAEIEKEAGVLLGTEPFYEYMDESLVRDCLFVRGDKDGTRMERHLNEYGRYMESLGGRDMGAVIVRAV